MGNVGLLLIQMVVLVMEDTKEETLNAFLASVGVPEL